MNSQRKLVLDEKAIARALARLAHEIAERNEQSQSVALLGIQTGGVHLAMRLSRNLQTIWNHPVPVGRIDASMHRDDLADGAAPQVHATEIPFDLKGLTVILVDDVLFSGRTVRAALDALNDYGRPQTIQLAVLIDRGHRQLPIKADFVGKNVPTSRQERVDVCWHEDGNGDSVYLRKL